MNYHKPTEKEMLRNIRKPHIFQLIVLSLIMSGFFFTVLIALVSAMVRLFDPQNTDDSGLFSALLLLGFLIVFCLLTYTTLRTSIKTVFFVRSLPVFQNYGSPQELIELVDQDMREVLYEYNGYVISRNSIININDYSSYIQIKDIHSYETRDWRRKERKRYVRIGKELLVFGKNQQESIFYYNKYLPSSMEMLTQALDLLANLRVAYKKSLFGPIPPESPASHTPETQNPIQPSYEMDTIPSIGSAPTEPDAQDSMPSIDETCQRMPTQPHCNPYVQPLTQEPVQPARQRINALSKTQQHALFMQRNYFRPSYEEVIEKMRNSYRPKLKNFYIFLAFVILFAVACICMIYETENLKFSICLLFIVFMWFLVFPNFKQDLIILRHPEQHPTFKRYGPPEKIIELVDQGIDKTIFQNGSIVITDEFIVDLSDYTTFLKLNDIQRIDRHNLPGNSLQPSQKQIVVVSKHQHTSLFSIPNDIREDELVASQIYHILSQHLPSP